MASLKNKRPLVIGVTGGMASGKTSVARMISGRGIIHVDADKLVHKLLQHDRSMIAEIAAAFPDAVTPGSSRGLPKKGRSKRQGIPARGRDDGHINRAELAAEISKNPKALSALEAIIHPRVRAAEEEVIAAARRSKLRAVVLDIPLLFETDADELCDVVIVAHAPLKLRRKRAFARPGMTEQKWKRLLDRQLSDRARNHAADKVISTATGKAETRREVQQLMKAWGLA